MEGTADMDLGQTSWLADKCGQAHPRGYVTALSQPAHCHALSIPKSVSLPA
jgi:hypothetical protein